MKRKRDTHDYHAPERVRKLKVLAARLDAHDLMALKYWVIEEQTAHAKAEHLATCQAIFADMQTWERCREMQVSRSFVLHNQITPGERLRFHSTYKGRKHIGAWFERDSGEKIWFALRNLDDLVPYDGKGVTDVEERWHAEFGRAMNAMVGEALSK